MLEKNKQIYNTFITIIRFVIFILLIKNVYIETGIYTAISLGLIFITLEYIGYLVTKVLQTIRLIVDKLKWS